MGKRNNKSIFIVGQLLVLIFISCRFNYFNVKNLGSISNEFIVIEDYSNYVVLENDKVKFLYYDDNALNVGNKVIIDGEITFISDDGEFYKYLKSQNIHYLINGEIKDNDLNLIFSKVIIDKLLANKDENNRDILKLVLFNEKDDSNSDFYHYFDIFSISFILVISGYHINLLFKVLDKSKILKYLITLFYLYLLNFSVSSLKAFLYYVLKRISKKCNLIINNCDILSLIMISLLFYNPSYCFNKGFIYSFSFSFIIDFINNIMVRKTKMVSLIKKIIIYLFSVPIILSDSYQINSNSFFVNIIFTYPMSFLFVFSFIYLFLDRFYLVYKLYLYLLRLLLGFFEKFSFNFIFGKPHMIVILVLYFSLILFLYFYQNRLYKKGYMMLMIFVFICILQYNIPNIDSREIVYFLDVGQGDCSVLKIKNSKSVVLIDTGGSKYRDLADDVIIPFLKSKGINRIDKIIISHDDFDHNGSMEELENNFKVNQIIEDSKMEEVYVGDRKFINLNVNENRDNDGSIVLYGNYGDINYLFSGDITGEIEKKIVNSEGNLDVDILKVSHHGSNSSTSEEFLMEIEAKVALIGVGKNNIYGHPSNEVIERLKKYNLAIYMTSKDGSISIYKSLISGKIIIETE